MKHLNQKQFICLVVVFFSIRTGFAQDEAIITTAVPFATISPDTRSASLGNTGVAISPDVNATYWNPAKLPFAKDQFGASITYTPWLRSLIGDMSISHLSVFSKLKNKTQAVGAYFTYFNLGSLEFTDNSGTSNGTFKPKEFNFTGVFAQKLSDHMGLSVSLRYINSNLSGSTFLPQVGQTNPGRTASGDIAWYYTKDTKLSGKPLNVAFGANVSNIGAKISYSSNGRREFIPTNLRIGTALTYEVDAMSKFTFALDLNKLLVPTPRVNQSSSDIPYLTGVIQSFSDAPGGLKEELHEVVVCSGVEYWYNNAFAVRVGFYDENKNKGNNKYLNLGVGLRTKSLGFDASYLVSTTRQSPLDGGIKFTLLFTLDSFRDAPKDIPEDAVN